MGACLSGAAAVAGPSPPRLSLSQQQPRHTRRQDGVAADGLDARGQTGAAGWRGVAAQSRATRVVACDPPSCPLGRRPHFLFHPPNPSLLLFYCTPNHSPCYAQGTASTSRVPWDPYHHTPGEATRP